MSWTHPETVWLCHIYEMMEAFFNDYFFIKKGGLIPGYIEEIEKMLRRIPDTEVYENMKKEYQSLNNVDEIKAHEIVDGQLAEVKSFISYDYVKEMDYIDKKINNYYSLYSTRILMVLSNNVNMQTYLNDLLMILKGFEDKEKSEVLQAISRCFLLQSYKYVGRKSIERRRKRKPNTKSGAIITSTLSEEEKARLTRELLFEYPDRYSVKQAAEYFDRLLREKESVMPDKAMIQTRVDAMMVAASIIYSGSGEFPYEVEFLPGMIETEIVKYDRQLYLQSIQKTEQQSSMGWQLLYCYKQSYLCRLVGFLQNQYTKQTLQCNVIKILCL
ncbi:MAG: DUF5716 family protein [Lachnospiraceae bacterium]|nr:DUF5716 family protein [Lachnospiraceae bacterium]MDD3616716.1 DUF5716 family protein [Lachnospiraceae bacterium]